MDTIDQRLIEEAAALLTTETAGWDAVHTVTMTLDGATGGLAVRAEGFWPHMTEADVTWVVR